MPDSGRDIADEQTILERLARAHKEWRDHRPPPPPPEDDTAVIARAWHKVQNPEPQDVEVIRAAREDPLRAAIWSQLSVVGWRLYAKGGVDLLSAVYHRIERDQHPGFAWEVLRAWTDIGFPGDPRGVWQGTSLF